LAEWLCRTANRIDPARMRGSFYLLRRGTSAPHAANLRSLLQYHQNAGHWTKIRRSIALFSGFDVSIHARSWADFITITFAFRFSVHTGGRGACSTNLTPDRLLYSVQSVLPCAASCALRRPSPIIDPRFAIHTNSDVETSMGDDRLQTNPDNTTRFLAAWALIRSRCLSPPSASAKVKFHA
jgi:hypothetical protein